MRTAVRRQATQGPNVSKGAFYEGLLATRCADLNAASSGTNLMARTSHIAVCDIRSLKIACPNYRVPSNSDGVEVAAGTTSTITASIEYPSGVFSQITFGGLVQGSIPSMTLLESDYCTPAQVIPSGATFWIRQFYTGSLALYSNGSLIGALCANTSLGDIFNSNTPTPIDRTMGGTIPQENANIFTMPPSAIMGRTNQPSVIVAGDSSGRGLHDVANITDARAGTICRGFPATSLAFLNHSSNSAGANPAHAGNYYITWSVNRRKLWKYASHLVDALGARCLYFGLDNAATTESAVRNNIWPQAPIRAKIIRTTVYAITTSSDQWATPGGQTVNGQMSEVNSFNNAIRAGLIGVFAFWEIARAIVDTPDNGLWKTDGNPDTYTDDGVHPVGPVGNNQAATAVNMANVSWP